MNFNHKAKTRWVSQKGEDLEARQKSVPDGDPRLGERQVEMERNPFLSSKDSTVVMQPHSYPFLILNHDLCQL